MHNFVTIHGAWSAGWAWWRMRALFFEMNNLFLTPTCTGLGDRSHLIGNHINLDTHIEDIVRFIECEDLWDVILIGHSYGGMVTTGVADRISERIKHLIYIDALLPESGECALDLMPSVQKISLIESAKNMGFGWLVPPAPLPPDTPELDVGLAKKLRGPQPLGTFSSPIKLEKNYVPLPSAYVYCKKNGPHDTFRTSALRAQSRDDMEYFEIDASHNPHITVPIQLTELILSIVKIPRK